MLSLLPERKTINLSEFIELKEEEERHRLAVQDIKLRHAAKLIDLEAKCLAVNGKHKDDGGMFVATCSLCGFCDDDYGGE